MLFVSHNFQGGRFNGKRSRGFDGDEDGYRNKRGRGGRGDRGRPHSYRLGQFLHFRLAGAKNFGLTVEV